MMRNRIRTRKKLLLPLLVIISIILCCYSVAAHAESTELISSNYNSNVDDGSTVVDYPMSVAAADAYHIDVNDDDEDTSSEFGSYLPAFLPSFTLSNATATATTRIQRPRKTTTTTTSTTPWPFSSRRSSSSAQQQKARPVITIGGLFPMHKAAFGGLVEAAQLAIEHVNRHANVLPDHELRMETVDSTCEPGMGVAMFLRLLQQRPRKVLIFGDVCSNVTDAVAQSVLYWNITQLTYGDTHPKYGEDWQTRYSNFFQIVPSENSFNAARIALLRHFQWHKIGTIYQYKPRFVLPHNDLIKQLSTAGVQVNVTVSFLDELKDQLDRLKDHNIRIIVGFFDEHSARQIFCRAYHIGLYGRRYQWIIAGEYQPQWWLHHQDTPEYSCTTEQLLEAIEGYLSVDVLPLNVANEEPTISKLTPSQFKQAFERRISNNRKLQLEQYSKYYGYAYDGIWAIAQAIQRVQQTLRNQIVYDSLGNLLMTIENDFTYRSERWGLLFRAALRNVTFRGVTGFVRFHQNTRVGLIAVRQLQLAAGAAAAVEQSVDGGVPVELTTANSAPSVAGKATDSAAVKSPITESAAEVKVAVYNAHTGILNFSRAGAAAPIHWKTSKPPKAEPRITQEHRYIYPAIFLSMSVLGVVGIIFATFFLYINIRFRNHRYIKMSSPYLNNLIVIGAMFAYIAVVLFGMDSSIVGPSNVHHVCAARVWVLSFGFTLAFGSMFSKTYRVNAIFTNVKLSRKVIKDYKLFIMVAALVLIDAIVLSIWQLKFPFVRVETHGRPEEDPETADIVIPIVESCESISPQYMKVFNFIVLSYKGLLLIFACFLAWSTRKVSIPALNDSKYIGLSVYNIVIFCAAGTAIAFVLEEEQQNYRILILCSFIIFCTTATLLLVFMPKVLELRRNPRADAHSRRVRATLKPARRERKNSFSDELDLQIRLIGEKNQKLRDMLAKRSRELEKLCRKLSDVAGGTPNKHTSSKHSNNKLQANHHPPGAGVERSSTTPRSSDVGVGTAATATAPTAASSDTANLFLNPGLHFTTQGGDEFDYTSQSLETSTYNRDSRPLQLIVSSADTRCMYVHYQPPPTGANAVASNEMAGMAAANTSSTTSGSTATAAGVAGGVVGTAGGRSTSSGTTAASTTTSTSESGEHRLMTTNSNTTSNTGDAGTGGTKATVARRVSLFVSNIANQIVRRRSSQTARRTPSQPAGAASAATPLVLAGKEVAASPTLSSKFQLIQRESGGFNTGTVTRVPLPTSSSSSWSSSALHTNPLYDNTSCSPVALNEPEHSSAGDGGVYIGGPSASASFMNYVGHRRRGVNRYNGGGMPAKQISFGSNNLTSPLHRLTADVNAPLANTDDELLSPSNISLSGPLSADSTCTMMVVGMPTVIMGSAVPGGPGTRLSPFPLFDSASDASHGIDGEFVSSTTSCCYGGEYDAVTEPMMLKKMNSSVVVDGGDDTKVQLVRKLIMSPTTSSSSAALNHVVAQELRAKMRAHNYKSGLLASWNKANNHNNSKSQEKARPADTVLTVSAQTNDNAAVVDASQIVKNDDEQQHQRISSGNDSSTTTITNGTSWERTTTSPSSPSSPSDTTTPTSTTPARVEQQEPPPKHQLETSFATNVPCTTASTSIPLHCSCFPDESTKRVQVQVLKLHFDYETLI